MRSRFFLVIVTLAATTLLVACEETVSPILESDQQFTVFGTLDMAQDTQYVRVIPIRPTPIASEESGLAASLSSTDLTSERSLTWRDSTVVFADGSTGHVFYARLRIQAGHTYRIEVQPDGSDVITSAETTVPARPVPEVIRESVTRTFTTRLHVRQSIYWDGVETEPYQIEHWYRFFRISDFSFVDLRLPYVPLNGPADGRPGVWEVDLNLVRDRDTLATMIDLNRSVSLAGLGMTITMLDQAFVPPGGRFDREALSQPGTFSNVTNGFGFIGSVGRFSVEWLVADTTARALLYIPLDAEARDKDGERVLDTVQRRAQETQPAHQRAGRE